MTSSLCLCGVGYWYPQIRRKSVDTARLVTTAATLLLLASCGDGGGSGNPVIPPPPAESVPASERVIDIASAGSSTCALRAGGDTFCWGRNWNGELGNRSLEQSGVAVRGAVGYIFAALVGTPDNHGQMCGLDSEQRAHCWGNNAGRPIYTFEGYSASYPVALPSHYRWISYAHADHACGVAADGQAYCWSDSRGEEIGSSGVPPAAGDLPRVNTDQRFTQIVVGLRYTCALATSATVYCWGWKPMLGDGLVNGPLGRATPAPIAGDLRLKSIAGAGEFTCGLDADGQAYCWGYRVPASVPLTPSRAGGDRRYVSLSGGGLRMCGLTSTGEAYCWGGNLAVTQVPGSIRFVRLAVAGPFACGVSEPGAAYCWGEGPRGELGNGEFASSTVPVRVKGVGGA